MTEIPARAGHVVAMCLDRDKVYIACEFAVYEVTAAAYPEPQKIREILTLVADRGGEERPK